MTYIQTPTSDPRKSSDFFSNLGFKKTSDKPVVFTDGRVFVEVNPERSSRTEIKLFAESWDDLKSNYGDKYLISEEENGSRLCDPNGIFVRLIEGAFPFEQEEESYGHTGKFAGISIEAFDVPKTLEFWTDLGFEKTMGDVESQGWGSYVHGETGISIMKPGMCPHIFPNPGLTYFNSGKNPEYISRMREAGITFTEEITVFNENGDVDNVILNAPGGIGFFVFND